ncbi:phosphatase PAP2 family protein [Streptomyces sp. M19]
MYAATVIGVLTTSWLVRFDWQVMLFRPYKHWPEFHTFLDYFVVMGQRGPTAVAVACWLGWCCYRQRTLRPLLVLGTSLLLLNLTVGAAKIGMGRAGPHYATTVGANEMWQGGDIFPSGHTANAVVTWGVLAYLATTPHTRRIASVIAATFAFGVGMTTVYLGTHWVSDVVLGWAAGVLVLLALPWLEPSMARAEVLLLRLWRRMRYGPAPAAAPAPALDAGLSTRGWHATTNCRAASRWASAAARPRPPRTGRPPRAPSYGGSSGRCPRSGSTTRSDRTPSVPRGHR